MKVHHDLLIGVHDHGTEQDDPPWSVVSACISALDGRTRTLVCCTQGDSTCMVGGGPELFICLITSAGGEVNIDLTDPLVSEAGQVQLVAGGQAGDFPRRNAVPLALALRAARWFHDHGGPDPDLSWESQ